MREVLLDIIKQVSGLSDIEAIKITGTKSETRVQCINKDKVLFVEATLNEAIPEFEGEFGISNFGLLKGLLEFTSYRTDNSTFEVKAREHKGGRSVEMFVFRNGKGVGADFRCMSPDQVPEQPEIKSIPWDVTATLSTSGLAEFTTLSSLYSAIDPLFGTKTDGGNLIAEFGSQGSSTHHAEMVLVSEVQGTLKGEPLWRLADFKTIMKGVSDPTIRISSRGVMGIETKTAYGVYKFYLRGQSR